MKHFFIHLFARQVTHVQQLVKHTAKRAGQQGKLFLLLSMIKNEEIKTAIHVACTYSKQSRK